MTDINPSAPSRPPASAARPACETFYNGACPICRTEIRHYQGLEDAGRLGWRNLADDPGALSAHGISAEDAVRRLHALDAEGRLHSGVDAFLLIWRNLGRYRWLAAIVGSRPIRPLADFIYERLAAPALVRFNRWRSRRP